MTMNFEQHDANFTAGVTSISPLHAVVDSTLNDSDKIFTVPAGEMWKVLYAFVSLTTSATVGNRQIRFTVTDSLGGNVEYYISAGAVQAASTTRSYGFMQGIYREAAFIDNMIQIPIPIDLYLSSGSTLRFWDSAAVDPAADDMTVSFSVHQYKGC